MPHWWIPTNNDDSAPVVQDCTSSELGRSHQQCRGGDQTCHEIRTVQTYLCQRNQWTLETFQLVDWTSFGRYFKSMSMAKRIKAAKYMSDWQNTGSQKEKFACSKTIKDPWEEEEYQANSRCPMQCRNCECLHCTKHPKPDEIKRCINSIAKWMSTVGTSKPLKIIILKAMREWLQEGKVESLDLSTGWRTRQSPSGFSWTETNRMAQFFKGRISQTWTAIQQSEYSRQIQHRINTNDDPLPKHYFGNWWTANLIKQVVFMSLNLWQIRNDALHADQIMTDYNTQRRLLQTKTATWNDKEKEFEAEDSKYFHQPYLERMYYRSESYTTSMVRDNRMSEFTGWTNIYERLQMAEIFEPFFLGTHTA